MLISITVISVTVAIIEIPPLLKEKMWKELITLISLLLLSILLTLQKVLGFSTPLTMIDNFLSPLGEKIFRYK